MNNNLPPQFARYDVEKYERFQIWLAKTHGQQVYTHFKRLAAEYRAAGNSKCGAQLIGNVVRWQCSVDTKLGYKVPNNYIPMMARQLMLDDPSFKGFFPIHEDEV